MTQPSYKDLQLDSTETVEISLGLKRRLGVNIKLESRKDITLAEVGDIDKATAATPK
jgi:acyl carrier protein